MNRQIATPFIIDLDTIKSVLPQIDVFSAITKGFLAYSKGEAVIPPVGELCFDKPPGEVHIKYGYLHSHPYYVVKIASGFYDNPQLGLPSSQGLNLLFDKSNGMLVAIILDQGHLTDVRTAVAGAIATQALAPPSAKKIGVVGTGTQGRLQLEYHKKIMDLEEVYYWNRNQTTAQQLAEEIQQGNCPATAVSDLEELCRNCQIIVTTTPATSYLVKSEWIQPGTHITAIGSDTTEKIELEPALLERADVVVADSLTQSKSHGEVFKANQAGFLKNKKPMELGSVLNNRNLGRKNDRQITVADLTGIAVQDLMISLCVFEKFKDLN